MSYKMNIDDVSDEELKMIEDRLHNGMKIRDKHDNVLWRLVVMERSRRKEGVGQS